MKIIFGLGNFGKQYENTNHNAGFIVVQKCLDSLGFAKGKNMCDGVVYEGNILGEKIYFVLPTTFMNNSGICVLSVISKLKANISDALVVVDDIDLPCGAVRVRTSGSAGTHNGLKSIVHYVGEGFARLRVGVGKPHENQQLLDFVLDKMSTSKEQQAGLEKAKECVLDFVHGKSFNELMQKYN